MRRKHGDGPNLQTRGEPILQAVEKSNVSTLRTPSRSKATKTRAADRSQAPADCPTVSSQGIDKKFVPQARKLGVFSDEKFEEAG